MKPFKTTLFILLFTTLCLAGCNNTGPEQEPEDPDKLTPITGEPYGIFSQRFESRMMAKWDDLGDGTYDITFSDRKVYTLDSKKIPVRVCTTTTWPAVVMKDGKWYVDGKDTGIVYTADRNEEEVVAVIYDKEAIYVRLSSGYIFFFHDGKVLDVSSFRFERALNPMLPKDIIGTLGNSKISTVFGSQIDRTSLVPTFATRGPMGNIVTGEMLTSSVTTIDCSSQVPLFVEIEGRKMPYTVSSSYGSIPVLRITTGRGVPTSKTNYISGTIKIEDPDLVYGTVANQTFEMEIRGRGNTTWHMPKKPFKIKLAGSQRLLGMSNNKHWTLLANNADRSLLRNSLAFKLSELAGMSWPIKWAPTELYIDGSYQGQYMLTEHVRLGDERIEMDVVPPGATEGGYLLCIDEKDLDPGYSNPLKVGFWHTNASNPGSRFPISFHDPEVPSPGQLEYVKSFLKEVENAIYHKSFDEYKNIMDVESAIAYFFVNEIAKNPDGNMRLSTYVTISPDGRFSFPCVWDFDLSFANSGYNGMDNPSGWLIKGSVWIRQLFRNREFCDLVTERWNELYPKLSELWPTVRGWASELDAAQRHNFEKWPLQGKSYQGEVDYLIDFTRRRIEWMNTEINAGKHFEG